MQKLEDGTYEIDLIRLINAVWNHIVSVIICTLLCGAIGFGISEYAVTPLYNADIMIYVNNNSISIGSSSLSISSSDLTASKSLVDTYIVILNSRSTLNEVSRQMSYKYTANEIGGMISASAVNSTEVFKITVTNASPTDAKDVANAIADVLPDKIADIVDGSSARIVDYAIQPTHRSYPSNFKYSAIGAVIGFVIICAVVCIIELMNDEVRDEDILNSNFPNIPVLAIIPNLESSTRSDKYDYYQYKNNYYKKGDRE